MTRSSQGDIESPGTNVAQKRGLNRAILAQGWAELARMLGYKLTERGGTLVKVPPAHTSQRCATCGEIDADSRHGRVFRCTTCGHAADADVNAAQNILAAGLGRDSAGSPPGTGRGDEPRTARRDQANAA